MQRGALLQARQQLTKTRAHMYCRMVGKPNSPPNAPTHLRARCGPASHCTTMEQPEFRRRCQRCKFKQHAAPTQAKLCRIQTQAHMCTPNTCAPTHPHLRIHTSTPARAYTSPQTTCAVSRAAAPNDHRRGEDYAAVVHTACLSNQQRLAHSTPTLVPWCRFTTSARPRR